MYKHIKGTFQSEYKQRSDEYKSRIIKWNSEPPITRVSKPTNVARARELGYRAKEGIALARVVVKGGTRKRKQAGGGRKPSKSGRYFAFTKSSQSIAEERAARKFTNFEVLNSYFVGAAGSRKFFEVILLDKNNPSILSDPKYAGVASQQGRAYRGLTSSGRRHRGIIRKRFGSHSMRPSKNRLTRTE